MAAYREPRFARLMEGRWTKGLRNRGSSEAQRAMRLFFASWYVLVLKVFLGGGTCLLCLVQLIKYFPSFLFKFIKKTSQGWSKFARGCSQILFPPFGQTTPHLQQYFPPVFEPSGGFPGCMSACFIVGYGDRPLPLLPLKSWRRAKSSITKNHTPSPNPPFFL